MLNIEAIEAFSDNYIWLLHDDSKAWVVDPGDANPVLETLSAKQLSLEGILVTHHHFDHVGGIDKLVETCGERLLVLGPAGSHPKITNVTDGEKLQVLGKQAVVGAIPGHTMDHIFFYFQDLKSVFCGDTLFAGGCGRVFEGTMENMFNSLAKLAALPANTQIYCAHEYTLSNLAFAAKADPDNPALKERQNSCQKLREQNQPTVPSTIEVELATNPFLRTDNNNIQLNLKNQHKWLGDKGWQVFQALREWKDSC